METKVVSQLHSLLSAARTMSASDFLEQAVWEARLERAYAAAHRAAAYRNIKRAIDACVRNQTVSARFRVRLRSLNANEHFGAPEIKEGDSDRKPKESPLGWLKAFAPPLETL